MPLSHRVLLTQASPGAHAVVIDEGRGEDVEAASVEEGSVEERGVVSGEAPTHDGVGGVGGDGAVGENGSLGEYQCCRRCSSAPRGSRARGPREAAAHPRGIRASGTGCPRAAARTTGSASARTVTNSEGPRRQLSGWRMAPSLPQAKRDGVRVDRAHSERNPEAPTTPGAPGQEPPTAYTTCVRTHAAGQGSREWSAGNTVGAGLTAPARACPRWSRTRARGARRRRGQAGSG